MSTVRAIPALPFESAIPVILAAPIVAALPVIAAAPLIVPIPIVSAPPVVSIRMIFPVVMKCRHMLDELCTANNI